MLMTRAPWIHAALAVGLLLACVAAPAGAATLELTGLSGTAVSVNGRAVGFLPLDGPLELAPGRYEITAGLSGYQDFSRIVTISAEGEELTVLVRLQRLSRATAWRSSVLFAGLGQFYVGNKTRGVIYATTEAGGLLTALAGELMRSDARKEHLSLLRDYNQAINADEVIRLREATAEKFTDMEDAEKLRDTALLVVAAAVVVSVADALITFPDVAAGPGPVPPMTSLRGDIAAPAPSLTAFHAGVRLKF
ncbi:MAG: PEGA domain-containing protein [bacterium]|nr:PEGA domain-containing protein [bacterium]